MVNTLKKNFKIENGEFVDLGDVCEKAAEPRYFHEVTNICKNLEDIKEVARVHLEDMAMMEQDCLHPESEPAIMFSFDLKYEDSYYSAESKANWSKDERGRTMFTGFQHSKMIKQNLTEDELSNISLLVSEDGFEWFYDGK